MDTDLLRQRLIDLREEKNLSQSELARQIGMDNTAISKIESRTRKVSAEELNLFSDLNFQVKCNDDNEFLIVV
ncbi:helix-turn-helix domain-containing protein [Lacticaseibacillus paracasei]|uniref:helix-turn-helix domain-containing protein n=1 Tax=Lacticaseibacillus paracasei TaxID=1597 RepID=UPI003BA0205C